MILKQKWSPKVKGFVLVFEDIVVLSVFQRLVACTPSVTASDCVVETRVMVLTKTGVLLIVLRFLLTRGEKRARWCGLNLRRTPVPDMSRLRKSFRDCTQTTKMVILTTCR